MSAELVTSAVTSLLGAAQVSASWTVDTYTALKNRSVPTHRLGLLQNVKLPKVAYSQKNSNFVAALKGLYVEI
jgi:hypothetical protein